MQNQRELLQKKLSESQKSILNLETKCQDFEMQIKELNEQNEANKSYDSYPTPKEASNDSNPNDSNPNDALSTDDLLSFFNMNSQLKPIDELIKKFVSEWQFNSQVFILDDDDEIKENEHIINSENKDNNSTTNRFTKWKEFEKILANISLELASMRENNTYQNESQQQFCALALDLLDQKILLIKHLGSVHMTKGQKMSQIMYEAQKRITLLQSELVKKSREMEMHLEVKHKMYDEIKNVQQQVQSLTREYQVVVRELDHIRGGGDTPDSSFS